MTVLLVVFIILWCFLFEMHFNWSLSAKWQSYANNFDIFRNIVVQQTKKHLLKGKRKKSIEWFENHIIKLIISKFNIVWNLGSVIYLDTPQPVHDVKTTLYGCWNNFKNVKITSCSSRDTVQFVFRSCEQLSKEFSTPQGY